MSGADQQTALERLWSQAIVAVSSAGEEAGRVAQRLAERAGLKPDDVKTHLREFTDRLSGQRRDLERSVEEAARRTLTSIRLPRREQVAELRSRVEALEARAAQLDQRR